MYAKAAWRYAWTMSERKQQPASTSRRSAAMRAAKTGIYVTKVGVWSKAKRVDQVKKVAAQRLKEARTGAAVKPSPKSDADKVELPGFVGMLRSGHADLAARAKDIVRGTDTKR